MPSSAVRTFADPDDWTTTFRGSRAELTITARGQFSAKLTWIRLHCLQMQRFFDSLPRILHVAHVHRRATISFLAPQGSPQRWGGIELTPGDVSSITWTRTIFSRHPASPRLALCRCRSRTSFPPVQRWSDAI
jgi:hypothetical protein